MVRPRFGVLMLAWGMAARGADVGDAESARAAMIEALRDDNAQLKRRLEKIRGTISYWAELGFTADKDGASEEEGPAASAEPASASGRGRRLESKLPGGVKVWQGGVLHNFQNAQSCEYSMVKVRPFGGAPVRPVCPGRARLVALGSSAPPGREAERMGVQPLPRALEPAVSQAAIIFRL